MSFYRAILFAIVIPCAGCIPARLQETPHVSGAVIDEQSHQPIAGATLHYEKYPNRLVHTTGDGQFDFPAIHRWQIVPIAPYDRFYRQGLIVEASGYERSEKSYGLSGVVTNQIFILKHE